jgi:hypothetical protein
MQPIQPKKTPIKPFNLSEIKKENHFNTPQKYFQSLPEVISYKTLNKSTLISFNDKLSYWSIPSSIAAIVLFFIFLKSTVNTSTTELPTNQLSEFIIQENDLQIEAYMVYEAYENSLQQETVSPIEIKDEYISYLLDNNIDIQTIIDTF